MFGLDISELMILLVVGIVVVGPKRLPELMRKAGGYVAKLRRLSTNLRAQSGIDRILREEGLDKEIRELRALRESLSKQAMLDGLVNAVNRPAPSKPLPAPKPAPALPAATTKGALPAADPDTSARKEGAVKDSVETKPADPATDAAVAKPAPPEAAALIKPAEGTIARGEATTPEPTVKNPFRSFREREYPPYGPDHYDALPDDLEEDELEEAAAAETDAISAAVPEVAS